MHAAFTVRAMTRPEIDIAVQWAADEGWNPGLADADCFHAADPQGFLIGHLDGEPVSCISVVRYAPAFGFLGFYIVKPGHRGRGHGLATWQAGMRHLQGRLVGLDGVPAQQDNYRQSGFRLAWRNIRFAGVGPGPAAGSGMRAAGLVSLATVGAEALLRFDRRFFPAERQAFLQRWYAQPGATALGLVQGGELAACGMVRPCRQGWKIGPLFALQPAGGRALFEALAGAMPAGEPLFLDVPEPNAQAVALARDWGMTPSFETARMYTGPAPDVDMAGMFGVTSFELG